MIQFVISPAKSLDFENQSPTTSQSEPSFIEDAQTVMQTLSGQSVDDLEKLMKISTKLAQLNVDRHMGWSSNNDSGTAKQAVFAFNGDVYTGLDAASIDEKHHDYMQNHLRILSGLYGVLKPLDLIMPYRLEMGSKLAVEAHKNLYQFWGSKLAEFIETDLGKEGVLLNLASNEYAKALQLNNFKNRVITIHFKEFKNDTYKVIGFFAKKARGLMARYLIDHEVTDAEKVKDFNAEGYVFHEALSDSSNWIFTR